MTTLLPAEEWIQHMERSERDYMEDRMVAIQSRDGNPEGVAIGHYGEALCLYSKTMPWAAFNTVKGFSREVLGCLDDIVAFYRSRERKAQFEIVPSRVDQRLLLELADRGFYQSGFHTSMYAVPTEQRLELPENVRIEELGADDFVAYATVHCRGTGLPDNGIPHVVENNRSLWSRPGWKFYMAYISGQPAAVAVMFTKDESASFTFAATLPEFRGRGLHGFLLKWRISEAFRQGCRLVVGQCTFLSQSHRNMERVGMKIGYVRTTWTEK